MAVKLLETDHGTGSCQCTDLEASTEDTDNKTSEMDWGNLGNILRRTHHASTETEKKTCKHQHLGVHGKSLHNGCNANTGVTNKVDTTTTDYISESQHRGTAEVTNAHEGIENTVGGTVITESVIFVPERERIDGANNTPIHTVTSLIATYPSHEFPSAS